MTDFMSSIRSLFAAWAGLLADVILKGIDRMRAPRLMRMVEQPDGTFRLSPATSDAGQSIVLKSVADGAENRDLAELLRGSRVELVLSARHFVHRTLELPRQAAEFAEGIVRAQIDRLSPWTSSAAVFGCSPPREIDAARMATSVAIMPRAVAMALVEPMARGGAASVAVIASSEAGDGSVIAVLDHRARDVLDRDRIARALLIGLTVICAVAVISAAGSRYMADRMRAEREAVIDQIGASRSQIRAGSDTPYSAALRVLERQKFETRPVSLVIEALTKALPDHTHLTELHINGSRLQIMGVSRDAPSLIRHIEQVPSFTRATFFAPTTRAASVPGEQFHIEAKIEPIRTAQP